MYYPYLRGKQFELLLLRENARLIANNNFHPIIEPVNHDLRALKRAIETLNDHSVNFTLIINPKTGSEPVKRNTLIDELVLSSQSTSSNMSIGYILEPQSKISNLKNLLSNHDEFGFTLIHYGFSEGKEISNLLDEYKNIRRNIFIDGFAGKLYQKYFKRNGIDRILIRDGFKPQKKNSLYPHNEHFSDLHITYDDEGMDGFGDFLTVGDDFSETGGPAYAVAIHLTYLNSDKDMFIHHFVSDQTDSPTNPGGKFFEALTKLAHAANQHNSLVFCSSACTEFLDLYRNQHFPGLGFAKKLSMKHHIELIAHYLRNKND